MAGAITSDQFSNLSRADLFIYARRKSDNLPFCLVVEASYRVDNEDVDPGVGAGQHPGYYSKQISAAPSQWASNSRRCRHGHYGRALTPGFQHFNVSPTYRYKTATNLPTLRNKEQTVQLTSANRVKQDADYIFHELTRSICPECKAVIDAQVIIRDNKVYMRKRCPEHGWFEGIISSDAEMYVGSVRFNKPGTIPLDFSTEVENGCPLDCGLCPEHKQHICLALIEVNTACNLDCPVCFADAGAGYNLTLEQVESMLDRFVEIEGDPEVVQFSGGEPTIHPATARR